MPAAMKNNLVRVTLSGLALLSLAASTVLAQTPQDRKTPTKGPTFFQPIKRVELPTSTGNEQRLSQDDSASWSVNPIDRFVRVKLQEHGLQPAGPAEKRTLIRRATLDLIGLPPTPAEVDAFLADQSPVAFAKVVERLLASSQYGERCGRHWLDVV